MIGLWVVLPYRSVSFARSDGAVVKLPAPDRLDHTSDTWDYLQIAREMYRSHRYESLFTYVPFLPDWVPRSGITARPGPVDRFPVLWRQPGFPLLVAGAFAVRGGPDPNVLLWIQGAAIALLPLCTYFLGRAFLTPGWAALAALWTLLAPIAVSPASPFVATTWFAGIVALLAGALVRASRIGFAVVAGLLLGIAIAFRFEGWMLLPALLFMLWQCVGSGRRRVTALVLGLAALVLLPWYRMQAQCAGEGFTLTSLLYHATDTFPGWTSSRTLAVRSLRPLEFLIEHPGDVLKKSCLDLLRYGRDLAVFPSPFLAPFVWIAVARPPAITRGFVYATVLAAAVLVVLLSPLEYSPRFLGVLAPFFAVTAAIGMSRFVRYRRALVVSATVIGCLLIGGGLIGRTHQGTARLAAQDLNVLMVGPETEELREGAIAFCDAPTLYAWIWGGRAVWTPLPNNVDKVRERLAGYGIVALFTRAAGHGDGITPNTIEDYVKTGGVTSAPEPPLTVIWPDGAEP